MSPGVPLPEGPLLGGFHRAIDPAAVAGLVSEHLAGGRDVRPLGPAYVRHKGEDGSLVGWWLEVAGAEEPVFVTLRSASPFRLKVEAERLADRHARTPAGLKKLVLLKDAGLLMLCFPLDRVLHRLRHLVRTHRVHRLAASELDGLVPEGWRPDRSRTRFTLVRYKPERRAVLRWDLALQSPDGARRKHSTTFWRLHAVEMAPAAFAALRAAHRAGLRCPEPLGLLGEQLSVESLLSGVPPELGAPIAGEQLREAGRLVARLHSSSPPEGARRLAPLDELDRAYKACADIGRLRSAAGQQADRVVERMAQALPSLSESLFLHGDLHPAQFLFEEGQAGLVDFDRACSGPPAHDLATFHAHLHAVGAPRAERLWDGFVTGYAEGRGMPDRAELAWFTAGALLRLAVMPFRSLATDWPARMRALVEAAAGWMECV